MLDSRVNRLQVIQMELERDTPRNTCGLYGSREKNPPSSEVAVRTRRAQTIGGEDPMWKMSAAVWLMNNISERLYKQYEARNPPRQSGPVPKYSFFNFD